MGRGTPLVPEATELRFLEADELGDLYEGVRAEDKQAVSIRVLPSDLDDGQRSSLSDLVSTLPRHPSLLAILAYGQLEDGRAYLISEPRLENRPISDPSAVAFDLCDGLMALHDAGLVHGAISPSSVCWSAGRWKLADAGLAKVLGLVPPAPDARVTELVAHLAPEVLAGSDCSVSADLFGLAAAIAELMTNRPLVEWREDEPLVRLAVRIASFEPESLGELAEPLRRALDPDPSRRPADAHRWASELAAKDVRTPELDEDVQFTLYKPRLVRPGVWHRLLAFTHRADVYLDDSGNEVDPAEEVRRQAAAVLGDEFGRYSTREADSMTGLVRGSEIHIVPEVHGLEFNPTQRSFMWQEPVHQESFSLRARADMDGKTARGHVRFYLGLLLLAEIPLAVKVSSGAEETVPAETPQSARLRSKVFVSYSHEDVDIVNFFMEVRRATEAIEILQDSATLATGDIWSDELARMIDRADTFQLFWSSNSMMSPHVRREWEYALGLGRHDFVKPCYWQDPMPSAPQAGLPPPELQRLHFGRLPRPSDQVLASARGAQRPDDLLDPAAEPDPSPTRTGREVLRSAPQSPAPSDTSPLAPESSLRRRFGSVRARLTGAAVAVASLGTAGGVTAATLGSSAAPVVVTTAPTKVHTTNFPPYVAQNGTCTDLTSSDSSSPRVVDEVLCNLTQGADVPESYVVYSQFGYPTDEQAYYASLLSENSLAMDEGTCATLSGPPAVSNTYCESSYFRADAAGRVFVYQGAPQFQLGNNASVASTCGSSSSAAVLGFSDDKTGQVGVAFACTTADDQGQRMFDDFYGGRLTFVP